MRIVAGDQVALVLGGEERDAVGVLGAEGGEHRREVAQRARGEVVALGGVDVEVVELLERPVELVGGDATGDDALLGGLLDVAAPLLVHAREHVVLGARLALGGAQRDLEVVLRLAGGEPALGDQRLPAELAQLGDDAGAGRLAPGRRHLVEAVDGLVGDAALDRGGVPAAGDHRRAHADGEGALRLEVGRHRGQPPGQVVGLPVDDRALGQVGQVALELRQLAVEDEPDAHERAGVVVPAEGLAAPVALDLAPGRGLEEAGPAAGGDEVAVLLGGHRTYDESAHRGRVVGTPCALGAAVVGWVAWDRGCPPGGPPLTEGNT